MDIQIINMTPHPVKDVNTGLSYESQGLVRVKETDVKEGTTPNGTTIFTRVFDNKVEGLSSSKEGTFYIVSSLVAEALKKEGRKDLLVPGPPVRDADGRIVGCNGFFATENTDLKALLNSNKDLEKTPKKKEKTGFSR